MRAKKGTTNATSTTAPALDILPPATPRFRGRIVNAYVDCEADLIELPTAPAAPQRPFEQQVAGSLTVNVGHPGGVTVKGVRRAAAHGRARRRRTPDVPAVYGCEPAVSTGEEMR